MSIKKQILCLLSFTLFISIFFSVCLLPFTLRSQEITDPQKNFIIEKRIEMIAEANEETEIDYTTLFDELNYLYENPLDLNFAGREQLQQLSLLTDVQINNLLKHITKNGKLISVYELQSIDGFDLQTIENILPFIKVTDRFDTPHVSLREVFKNSSSQLLLRETRVLEQQEGFEPIDDSTLAAKPNSRYLGSPDKLYARYRFNFGNKISAGFTAEKDPGEEFFKGTQQYGFDFYSAHLYLRNFGRIKFLAIGDYQVNLGQGLTFWSGLAFSKTADAINIKRNPLTIRPFVSAMENLFMRGAAATAAIKNFEITGFYSFKKIDAVRAESTDSTVAEDDFIISSMPVSGFHRTPSEVAQKHNLSETIYGGNISYVKRRGKIGISAASSHWGGNFQQRVYPYNQFTLNTADNFNIGADYSYIVRNLSFFGEAARSDNGGLAFLNGAIATLSQDVSISLVHRNFQKNYQSLYSTAFSETRGTNNEKGLYFGVNARLNSDFTFSGYMDKFEFPWLKYQVNAPSEGVDFLAQLTYKPFKKLEVYARYRQKIKGGNARDPAAMIDYLTDTEKETVRLNSSFRVTESVTLRNRVEFLKFRNGEELPEFGYLIYQDISFRSKSMKFPFSCSFRFAMFETESYNSRIYAYENDVLYAFSIPAYYYRGTRTYLILQYKLVRNVDIWLRIAQTYYSNRDVISSGLSEIEGSAKTEVKAQVRYRF